MMYRGLKHVSALTNTEGLFAPECEKFLEMLSRKLELEFNLPLPSAPTRRLMNPEKNSLQESVFV